MITTKQRAELKSIANKTESSLQIGKDGVTESVLKQIDDILIAREIIKITILKTCPETQDDCMNKICDNLSAEQVQKIGSKIVIYKMSNKKGIKHILA